MAYSKYVIKAPNREELDGIKDARERDLAVYAIRFDRDPVQQEDGTWEWIYERSDQM